MKVDTFEFSLCVKCDCGAINIVDEKADFGIGYERLENDGEDILWLSFHCGNCDKIIKIEVIDLFA